MDLGIAHEVFPAESAAGVLDHADDRSLIDGDIVFRKPIALEIEGIVESERSPETLAQRVVVVLHCQE